MFSWLATLNREFAAIATQLQPLQSLGVYHAGMLPPGAMPMPKDAAFAFDPPIQATDFVKQKKVTGALLGTFGPSGEGSPTHVVVVNLDYEKGAIFNLRAPGSLEIFDPFRSRWSPVEADRVELRLPGGGGKLLRIRP
jgi:hypothetical protein